MPLASEPTTQSNKRCCSPASHRAALRDLAQDAEVDRDIAALLPAARKIFGTPEPELTANIVRDGAAEAIADFETQVSRRHRRVQHGAEPEEALPWWAR